MAEMTRTLTEHSGTLLLILMIAVLGLLVGVVVLTRRIAATKALWMRLAAESSGEKLETMLERHLDERRRLRERVEALEKRAERSEALLATAKRHCGFVRFDAFEDVGGKQSFALALYDDRGDGAVISSIVGRRDHRVFGKPLHKGASPFGLSNEETRAIESAYSGKAAKE